MSEHPTTTGETERTEMLPDSAVEARVIGHYRLLQKIGEGGMGEVWEAEQTEPVQRRVALKLIKPGMDSAQVIARFETERQALALMDHPAIAKVFLKSHSREPYVRAEHRNGSRGTTRGTR